MYRQPRPPTPSEPPTELVYPAADRGRPHGSTVAFFKLVSLPGLVGVALASAVSPAAGLFGLLGAGAFATWRWHGPPHQAGAVLRMAGDQVVLLSRNGKQELARFRLDELTDVELDTKTIERVQEANGPVPGLPFMQNSVGPKIDTARIALVVRGEAIFLTEDYLTHFETLEWFNRIRLFFRKHGWAPADEVEIEVEVEAEVPADEVAVDEAPARPRRRKKRRAARRGAEHPLGQ